MIRVDIHYNLWFNGTMKNDIADDERVYEIIEKLHTTRRELDELLDVLEGALKGPLTYGAVAEKMKKMKGYGDDPDEMFRVQIGVGILRKLYRKHINDILTKHGRLKD